MKHFILLLCTFWVCSACAQQQTSLSSIVTSKDNTYNFGRTRVAETTVGGQGIGFFAAPPQDTLGDLLNKISIQSIKKNLFFLAGDKCQGRMTASHGDSVAATYVEQWMQKNKLKPGVQGSYRQPVTFIDNYATVEKFAINNIDKKRFDNWDYQWQLFAFSKGVAINNAPLVFINYGIDTKRYKDFDNVDVKGKVVVHITGYNKYLTDSMISPEELKGNLKNYEEKGALAAILIPANFNYEDVAEMQRRSAAFKLYTLKSDTSSYTAKDKNPFPFFYASTSLFKELLQDNAAIKDSLMNSAAYIKHDPQAFDLNKTISINIQRKLSDVISPNIIATIKGYDDNAGYIVFTAHRDHEGMAYDSTWYGADDNASGTAALMECAKAIAAFSKKGIHPKRSIIFISTTAEEHGLLGAAYFAQNPTVPLSKIKYALNIDMLGRVDSKHTIGNRTDTNYVYPLYYDSMYNFKPLLENISKKTRLVIDDYYLKNSTEEDMIQRSDHIIFGEKGIPFIWFFSGLHKDYHQPTDTPDKINYTLLAQRTKLALGVLWQLANE